MIRKHPCLLTAVAAVVVCCGLITPAGAAASAAGRGFQPGDFTAISDLDWWLLGTVPCGKAQCLAILRTQDGGRSFTALPTPPSSTAQHATVSQLRFANARDGYAFGPELWSTHDGGRSWRQLQIGYTDALVTAGGYAYALVSDRGPSRLMRSPVGHDAWRALNTPARASLTGLSADGATVILRAGSRSLISTDRGRHLRPGGHLPAGSSCDFDAIAGTAVIWGMCGQARAGGCCSLIRSATAGDHWAALTLSGLVKGPPQAFAAASATVALVAGYQRLCRTTDGGASWSPAAGLPRTFSATYLGFTDATHGVAIGGVGIGRHHTTRLYYTTNAGASYRRVSLRSR